MIQQVLTQLTLGLHLQDEATFANFYSSKNEEIVTALKNTASGAGERLVYLCGTRGQGRSHLLQACCHHAGQHQLRSGYFPLANLLTMTSQVLDGLEALDLVCIDDLHIAAQKPEWEEAIFHLYNRIYDVGGRMIIAAHDLPKALNMGLPDLVSRLSWGMIYQLQPLLDQEKLSILTRRAEQRGIHLSNEVGRYLLTHCPRHMGTLCAALDVLDRASLSAQRRLTIPFVKEILQI